MKTHEILQMTTSDFDVIMYRAFMEWAMLRTLDNKRVAQKLMQYKPISKWFAMEFSKRCDEFKKDIKPYLSNPDIDVNTRIKFFWDIIDSIFYIYPSVLMKSFQKELIETSKTK